ncbi:hypothetical protein PG999_011956 [Apiospora kogelbergensis]|uniref:Uncharacterized protein n=1 Tax=Apiospora kogelbergensis TaxID=1337665 RepID=A0AAW0QFU6_9PEZI
MVMIVGVTMGSLTVAAVVATLMGHWWRKKRRGLREKKKKKQQQQGNGAEETRGTTTGRSEVEEREGADDDSDDNNSIQGDDDGDGVLVEAPEEEDIGYTSFPLSCRVLQRESRGSFGRLFAALRGYEVIRSKSVDIQTRTTGWSRRPSV